MHINRLLCIITIALPLHNTRWNIDNFQFIRFFVTYINVPDKFVFHLLFLQVSWYFHVSVFQILLRKVTDKNSLNDISNFILPIVKAFLKSIPSWLANEICCTKKTRQNKVYIKKYLSRRFNFWEIWNFTTQFNCDRLPCNFDRPCCCTYS